MGFTSQSPQQRQSVITSVDMIEKPHSSAGHEKGGANHVFLKEGGRNVQPQENTMLGSLPKYPGELFWKKKKGAVSQAPCGMTGSG